MFWKQKLLQLCSFYLASSQLLINQSVRVMLLDEPLVCAFNLSNSACIRFCVLSNKVGTSSVVKPSQDISGNTWIMLWPASKRNKMHEWTRTCYVSATHLYRIFFRLHRETNILTPLPAEYSFGFERQCGIHLFWMAAIFRFHGVYPPERITIWRHAVVSLYTLDSAYSLHPTYLIGLWIMFPTNRRQVRMGMPIIIPFSPQPLLSQWLATNMRALKNRQPKICNSH